MDPLRHFVLRSHRWPFFNRSYASVYRVGRSLLGVLGRQDPDLKGMFLRVSDDPDLPGLSDYDLTVTPREASTTERLEFLGRFWRRYAGVKRFLPMLGETDILPPPDLIDYMLFGPGPTAARKRLSILFERLPPRWKGPFREAYERQGDRVSQDELLREALLRHIRFVVPRALEHSLNPDFTRDLMLDHAASRIFSIVNRTIPPAGERSSTLHRELRELTRACRRQDIPAKAEKAGVMPAEGQGPEVLRLLLRLLLPLLRPVLRSVDYPAPSILLWTGLASRGRSCLAVVAEDGLEEKPLLALVRGLAGAWRAGGDIWQRFFSNDPYQAYFPTPPYPVFLSRSMWRSWMYMSPFEAAAVSAGGCLVAGDDSILTEATPYSGMLPGYVSAHYAAMLSLRNNWRTLTPEKRPGFYPLAIDLVRAWRSALEGGPIRTGQRSGRAETPGLSRGYEILQRELTGLRSQLPIH